MKLSTKTAEKHLIIGMTLVHSVMSIVFKSLAFLKLEFYPNQTGLLFEGGGGGFILTFLFSTIAMARLVRA